ncbi:MAG: hypothetical protein ACE5J9_09750 [Methanosarcinales archaeon]
MVSKKEYKDFSECHYRMALKYHKKGINESDDLKKLTYLSDAVSHLLVSTDHLLNWFLYPNVFKSRTARYRSFEASRKISKGLSGKKQCCVIIHPFAIVNMRNKLWYLSDQKSIPDAIGDLTIKELNKLFKEADYVRDVLNKI